VQAEVSSPAAEYVRYFPAVHAVQLEDAAPEYSPVPQKEQVDSLVAPVDELYFPAAHSLQAEAPVDELNLPAVQAVQEGDAAPEYSPVPQKEQVDSLVAPVDALNFPAAQSVQAEAPLDELNFPAAQSEQVIAPIELNFPAPHVSQSEFEPPREGLYEPASQW